MYRVRGISTVIIYIYIKRDCGAAEVKVEEGYCAGNI